MNQLDLRASTRLLRMLADPSRLRLLALLAHEELSVAELQAVTSLTQSRVSSHLSRLREAGWLTARREGPSTYYRLEEERMDPTARRLWRDLLERSRDPLLERDRRRLEEVLRAREEHATWADLVAGRMERHYSPGRTWQTTAWGLLGFCRLRDVLDVASGDGVLAELLSPRARSVTCLDRSDRVVRAGRRRLAHVEAVRFVRGDMHALPFGPERFDQVLLMNALPYARRADRVFEECARVLREGGELAGACLRRHQDRETLRRYDHVNFGFEPAEIEEMLDAAGFETGFVGVTSRERRTPHHEVVTFHARRPHAGRGRARRRGSR